MGAARVAGGAVDSARGLAHSPSAMHIVDELAARGMLKDCTDEEGLRARLDAGPITFYCGHDPTAPSLTIGNLVPIMLQAHIQRAGHKPIVLMGGGTALFGDPTGKAAARDELPEDEIARNLAGQRPQFDRFITFGEGPTDGLLVNNADWLRELGYVQFMRDVGAHFSVNEMVQAETYRNRLQNNQHLPFIEFNYRLVQAYDFLHLFRVHGCELQIGGSDQWGNCVAGTELIRKAVGGKGWVLTAPLLLTASGQKMGKTEKGAVWLSAERTSPFEYFQYWINCDDRDVGKLLRWFTFLPLDAIAPLEAAQELSELMTSKARLAWETTRLCHGIDAADQALATSMLLFGLDQHFSFGQITGGRPEVRPDVPTLVLPRSRFEEGVPVFKLFVESGLAGSGKQAKQLVQQGAATVGATRATDPFDPVGLESLSNGAVLLRAGKKKYCLVVAE